ncbi:MAG TPA: alpha/beta fold hydrolase [Thermohalobaculum sp.]|nr:alpha/beta fold hydrolase [Thermohalobaculum sp.]
MLPIVWIPGHLCGPWLYAQQLGIFGGARETILADTLRDDDLGAMAERLLAGAPERFVVAGLSMGGMVAMEVLARAPGRVAGAVLMDTDPSRARAKEIEWRGGLLDRAEREGLDAYVGTFVHRFYMHDQAVAGRLEAMTRRLMGETPLAVARAQARALDRRREMVPLIAGYDGPVEVIVGAEDKICPPLLHGPIAAALPGAVHTEIPGCGHLATLEAPEPVNARIAALLERVEASR